MIANPKINWRSSLNRGLAAWWLASRQTSGGGVWRDLVSGYRATAANVTWQGSTRQSLVPVFNGSNSEFAAPSNPATQNASALTYSCWFYLADSSNGGLIEQSGSGDAVNSYALLFREGSNLKMRTVHLGNAEAASVAITEGVWLFGTGTYDGTNIKVYLNGVLGDTLAGGDPSNGAGHLYIGHLGSGLYYLNGMMDDVRIYRRALPAQEVMQAYLDSRSDYRATLLRRPKPVRGFASAAAAFRFPSLFGFERPSFVS